VNDAVVDASVLVCALAENSARAASVRERLAVTECHAPHLVDAEVGQALRRMTRSGKLDADQAVTALRALKDAVEERYPQAIALAELSWSMRDNLTYYDGLYVGLAAILRIPLLTLDARLAKAPNLPCEVELVADM
jgi:predicted nucleic acid-binding protein